MIFLDKAIGLFYNNTVNKSMWSKYETTYCIGYTRRY